MFSVQIGNDGAVDRRLIAFFSLDLRLIPEHRDDNVLAARGEQENLDDNQAYQPMYRGRQG